MPSILDFLRDKIPKELLNYVKKSYDIIGDIAVIDIPKELEDYEIEIAEAIKKVHKNVNVVAKIQSKTEGIYRIRKVKVILGEDRTYTYHKENGLIFYLDLNKVFYTPRLANERRRILNLVNDNEIIGDLFAGVGPYSILIAKNKKVYVYSSDINPNAFSYLLKNIYLNKTFNINAYNIDSKKLVKRYFNYFFDRIIMNIPKFSENFLDIPFISLKSNGVCHYYDFSEKEKINLITEKIKEYGKKYNRDITIENIKILNEISPRVYRIVIDFRVR